MHAERYLHGFGLEEKRRLVQQAEFWRDTLIPLGLSYASGDRVLEIGCAVGASLAVLAETFPGIQMAGIDLESSQIEFAQDHLDSLGLTGSELRVGNAKSLPWEDGTFDHVFIMWLLEHLGDPSITLREAFRVLKPGGSICVTETDYTTFQVYPHHPDFEYLSRAQQDFFARHGQVCAGRMQGNLLAAAGFANVSNAPVGFHAFARGGRGKLHGYVNYIAGFLEPAIPQLAEALGLDSSQLHRGLEHLLSVADHPDGAFTQIVYRAHATRAEDSRPEMPSLPEKDRCHAIRRGPRPPRPPSASRRR